MLGQPAGMKVDIENSEPQESRWVIGLHGKPRGPGTAPQRLLAEQAGDQCSQTTVSVWFSAGPRFQPKTTARPLRE
jgi:hypothetical protein